MQTQSLKLTIATLMVGGLFGYLSARPVTEPTLNAAVPNHALEAGSRSVDRPTLPVEALSQMSVESRCTSGINRNDQIALATNNPIATAAFGQVGATKKPNILVIFGDDVGYWNISAFHGGLMGYDTPNIDRLAKEGGKLVSYYAQQSCTAGRSAFITGQLPFRTGMSKVGLPGAALGLQKQDPTIAEMLKPLGYVTGQFGKNHLGDRDEFLPTNHGFDEFFGNLYHLNAEEEPENTDYPKGVNFRKKYGPRGVIHSTADGKVTDTGPLNIKRMETIDEEILAKAEDFLDRTTKSEKPFFMWFNTTHMHNFTHVKPEDQGKTGLGFYADGMVYHDRIVGKLLDYVDKLGIQDNTIVVYTTDNGPMVCLFPDAGTTPFRSEKNTNWDGGWRVPALIRWPGVVKPGTTFQGIFAGEDWMPTLLAAAGNPNVKEELLKGKQAGNMTYKVHLDGYNQMDYLSGKSPESARKEFFYFSDDGDLLAVRYDRIKVHFMIQEATGIDVWRRPFTHLRAPIFFDLAVDPGERGQEGMNYNDWWYRRAYILVPIQEMVGKMIATFKDYPPRQKPASFTVDQALQSLDKSAGQ